LIGDLIDDIEKLKKKYKDKGELDPEDEKILDDLLD